MTDLPDSIRYPKELLSLAELDDEQIKEGMRKAKEAGVAEEDMFEAIYDYGHLGLEPIALIDDYIAPKEAKRFKDPELNKSGDGLKQNEDTQPQIRVNPSVFNGTGVRVTPPRRNRPLTTPRPSTPRPGSRR